MKDTNRAKMKKERLVDARKRVDLAKANYKRLWEDYQTLKDDYRTALKGTEQIEKSLDSFIGAMLLPLGGEITLKKADLVKEYEVTITHDEDTYKVVAHERDSH